MTKLTVTNAERIEMGVPLIYDLALTPPEDEEPLEVMSATVRFWAMCGIGMGAISQLAGIGVAFLGVDKNTSSEMCWALLISVNILFFFLEIFLFRFVCDIVRLQVAHARTNEDMKALVDNWRNAFIMGLAAGAICVGIFAVAKSSVL
eukprot:CAMPEP_0198251126 /NCGR_PEP_ID=MMETSP1447-20131203/2069_1 /TAXON_ID=420782 /ORGANISM="Chaetoceros dichaeta, Strain CCMP1751" /LENGTH=147 /DNA_ID=CAMNT_0043936083 /DNA_START=64 /DNA_END=507 /DNA_ORIENTATION=-